MSNRTVMRRYMHGGGVQSTPASGNVAPLIPALFGKDKVTGGLQVGPDGRVQYTPAEGSSGFLGNWSRGQAGQMNDQILKAMMLQQMSGDTQLANTKEQGVQARMTQAQRNEFDKAMAEGNHQKAIEILQKTAAENRETKRSEQSGELMTKQGLVPNSANERVLDETTRDQTIKNVANKGIMAGTELELRNRALTGPKMPEAIERGMLATEMMPEAQFKLLSSVQAGPNQSVFQPGDTMGVGYNQFRGPSISEQTTMEGGFVNPLDPTAPPMNQKPVTRSVQTAPAGISPINTPRPLPSPEEVAAARAKRLAAEQERVETDADTTVPMNWNPGVSLNGVSAVPPNMQQSLTATPQTQAPTIQDIMRLINQFGPRQ